MTSMPLDLERCAAILLNGTAQHTGSRFFNALARCTCDALQTKQAFVGELLPCGSRIRSIANWNWGLKSEPFEYALKSTPCADAMDKGYRFYPCAVQRHFPEDRLLVDMGIEGYLGVAIRDHNGNPLGILVAIHDHPLAVPQGIDAVLGLFASRAAAEMARQHSDKELALSEARYRQIVSTCLEGVWMIDEFSNTTFVNDRMAKMMGHLPSEMIGKPLFDFMDDASIQKAKVNV